MGDERNIIQLSKGIKPWYTRQNAWTLKTRSVKAARHKRPQIIGLHPHKMSGRGDSTETERRLLVHRNERHKGMQSDWNGCGVSFQGNENVLKLTMAMAVQLYEHTKNQWIRCSTRVNFIVCELYLNTALVKLATNPHSNPKWRFSSSLERWAVLVKQRDELTDPALLTRLQELADLEKTQHCRI